MNAYDITGKVLINIRVIDTGVITDLANFGLTGSSPTYPIASTNYTKFSKYSINAGYNHDLHKKHLNISTLIGNKDFTVSTWIYRKGSLIFNSNANTSDNVFFIYPNSGNSDYYNGFRMNYLTTDKFCITNGESIVASSSSAVPYDQWIHVAITRKTNVYRIFINGIKIIEYANSGLSSFQLTDGTIKMMDAYNTSTSSSTTVERYYDDYVFIVGQALWTDAFTPPTSYLYTPPDEIRKYLKQY